MLSFLVAASTQPARSTGWNWDTRLTLAVVGALLFWIVLYFVYRVIMTGRKDFGLPVRRRLLARKLRVDRDQSAEVPFWWTDLQVQRAIRSYWRNSLRTPFAAAPGGPAGARPRLSNDTNL